MKIGVVVGMAVEARIARRLGWPIAVGGGTASGAHAAAEELLRAGVSALVSFGVAGGLDPNLPAGTILVPTAVLDASSRYETDADLCRILGGATPHTLLSLDVLLESREQRRQYHEQTLAAAVDMESGAVAQIAARDALPFAVLRVICDTAERRLPPVALTALDAEGRIGMRRVLGSLASDPRQLPDLIRLAMDAKAARRALLAHVRRVAQT
jgi:adenosylhomocysteine nucleosidase